MGSELRPPPLLWILGTGLLYAAICAILWMPQLLGQRTLFAGDISQHYLPWEHFVSRELTRGQLPVLDPEFYLGHPILAEGQAGVFYPPTRLWYATIGRGQLAGDIQAFNGDVLGHWWIAGWGIWFAAMLLGLPWRSAFLAGLLGCVAGELLVLPVNMPLLRVLAWTGWLLGATTATLRWGTWTALLGTLVCWSLMLLAGGPQMTALVGIAVVVFALGSLPSEWHNNPYPWRSVALWSLTPLVAALLTAFQLIPTWQLYQESAIRQFGGSEALAYSASWSRIATFLFPPTWLMRMPPEHPLPSYLPLGLWIGTAGALAGCIGLVVKTTPARLKIMLGTLVAFALGAATPVYPLLLKAIPLLGLFRAPDRYLGIAVLGWCLIAGFGIEALLRSEEAEEPVRRRLAGVLLGCWIGGTLLVAGFLGADAVRQSAAVAGVAESWWQVLKAMAPELGLQVGIGGLFLMATWPSLIRRLHPAVTVTGIAVLTLVQVIAIRPVVGPLQTMALADFATPPPVAAAIAEAHADNPTANWGRVVVADPVGQASGLFGGYEVQTPGAEFASTDILAWHHGVGSSEAQQAKHRMLFPNTGTLYGLEYVGGIASLYTARMNEFLLQLEGAQLRPLMTQSPRPAGTTLLDLAGGRYIMVPNAPPAGSFPSRTIGDQVVAINPRAKPLAWIMQPAALMPETPGNLHAAVELNLDPGRMLILDSVTSPQALPAPLPSVPVVAWHWVSNGSLSMDVEPAGPCWLIVNLQWLPGWSATVNGRAVPLHRAWGTFLALPLNAGPQQITCRYTPPGFAAGLQISGATLLLLCGLVIGFGPPGQWLRERFSMGSASRTTAIALYDDDD